MQEKNCDLSKNVNSKTKHANYSKYNRSKIIINSKNNNQINYNDLNSTFLLDNDYDINSLANSLQNSINFNNYEFINCVDTNYYYHYYSNNNHFSKYNINEKEINITNVTNSKLKIKKIYSNDYNVYDTNIHNNNNSQLNNIELIEPCSTSIDNSTNGSKSNKNLTKEKNYSNLKELNNYIKNIYSEDYNSNNSDVSTTSEDSNEDLIYLLNLNKEKNTLNKFYEDDNFEFNNLNKSNNNSYLNLLKELSTVNNKENSKFNISKKISFLRNSNLNQRIKNGNTMKLLKKKRNNI